MAPYMVVKHCRLAIVSGISNNGSSRLEGDLGGIAYARLMSILLGLALE